MLWYKNCSLAEFTYVKQYCKNAKSFSCLSAFCTTTLIWSNSYWCITAVRRGKAAFSYIIISIDRTQSVVSSKACGQTSCSKTKQFAHRHSCVTVASVLSLITCLAMSWSWYVNLCVQLKRHIWVVSNYKYNINAFQKNCLKAFFV